MLESGECRIDRHLGLTASREGLPFSIQVQHCWLYDVFHILLHHPSGNEHPVTCWATFTSVFCLAVFLLNKQRAADIMNPV